MADDGNDAAQQQDEQQEPAGGSSGPGRLTMIVLAVATVGVAAGAGVGLRIVLAGGGPRDEAVEPEPPEVPDLEDEDEFVYYEFDPITVNANVPRRDRYIRATLILAIGEQRSKKVTAQLDKKKPEVMNWLTVYLSGLTLEELGGPESLNRIREEICAKLNDKLWPGHPGQIHHVLLKDFAVQ